MKSIVFYELNVKSSLRERRKLKKFLLTLFNLEKVEIERVQVIFCRDGYLLSLNKTFLNHAYYTDTLTFLLSEKTKAIIAEVYISIPRVKANAKSFNISYKSELLRVIIHSCLHLCGYEDNHKSKKRNMKKKQEYYLKKLICFT